MTRPGVIIVDAVRQIRVVTPAAEELLGWQSEKVVGAPCTSVFDCRDVAGASLCTRCGLGAALERQEVIPPEPVDVADGAGRRRYVTISFWYLPPEGRIYEPRVMAILHDAGEAAPPA